MEYKSFSIIGAGKVGRTLGYLLYNSGLKIQSVLNTSKNSARAAASFIGGGAAVAEISDLIPSDIYMISVNDDAIEDCLTSLEDSGILREGNLVFHCSGSKSSALLEPLLKYGALTASLHPVMSFSYPSQCKAEFKGVFCAVEGGEKALEILRKLVNNIGGIPFDVKSEEKMIYHAGAVFVCNYLNVILDIGLQCIAKSGVDQLHAKNILFPIVRGTLENISHSSPANALTGPIARGDKNLVRKQTKALEMWNEEFANIYKVLGLRGIELSREKGVANPQNLEIIKEIFNS